MALLPRLTFGASVNYAAPAIDTYSGGTPSTDYSALDTYSGGTPSTDYSALNTYSGGIPETP